MGGGVQFTIQGGSVFNKGVQYTMDVNRPRVQFTMGFKIPYDTGVKIPYDTGGDIISIISFVLGAMCTMIYTKEQIQ